MKRFFGLLLALATVFAPSAFAQSPKTWGPVTAYSVVTPFPGSSPVPASLAGSASWVSACVPSLYSRAFDVVAAVAGTATLQIQRYADVTTVSGSTTVPGCTLPVGAAVPSTALALTSGGGCPGSTYCGDVGINDGMPFAAIVVTLTDTSGSTNAVTSVTLLQGAE